jgi:hypothetical protein
MGMDMDTGMPDAPRHGGGPGGDCTCLKCGTKVPHKPGLPCRQTKCPECGATLVREGSEHHRAFLQKSKDAS